MVRILSDKLFSWVLKNDKVRVVLCIKLGADVNYLNGINLRYAALNEFKDMCEILIKYGANKNEAILFSWNNKQRNFLKKLK